MTNKTKTLRDEIRDCEICKSQEPLDKKIYNPEIEGSKEYPVLDVQDVKSSLSNLKKRLKEAIDSTTFYNHKTEMMFIEYFNKIFSEEIGKGLLEDNDEI